MSDEWGILRKDEVLLGEKILWIITKTILPIHQLFNPSLPTRVCSPARPSIRHRGETLSPIQHVETFWKKLPIRRLHRKYIWNMVPIWNRLPIPNFFFTIIYNILIVHASSYFYSALWYLIYLSCDSYFYLLSYVDQSIQHMIISYYTESYIAMYHVRLVIFPLFYIYFLFVFYSLL